MYNDVIMKEAQKNDRIKGDRENARTEAIQSMAMSFQRIADALEQLLTVLTKPKGKEDRGNSDTFT